MKSTQVILSTTHNGVALDAGLPNKDDRYKKYKNIGTMVPIIKKDIKTKLSLASNGEDPETKGQIKPLPKSRQPLSQKVILRCSVLGLSGYPRIPFNRGWTNSKPFMFRVSDSSVNKRQESSLSCYDQKLQITELIFNTPRFALDKDTIEMVFAGEFLNGILQEKRLISDPLKKEIESLGVVGEENINNMYYFLSDSTTHENFAARYFLNAESSEGKITPEEASLAYKTIKDLDMFPIYTNTGKAAVQLYTNIRGLQIDILREASTMIKDLLFYAALSGISIELTSGDSLELLFNKIKRAVLERLKTKTLV